MFETGTRVKYWYPSNRGPVTPWGNADSRETYAEGIDFYSTPSHEGFYISRKREAELDTKLRAEGITAEQARMGYKAGWYEGDCSAFAVMFAWPELFPNGELPYVAADEYLEQLSYWLRPREAFATDRERRKTT